MSWMAKKCLIEENRYTLLLSMDFFYYSSFTESDIIRRREMPDPSLLRRESQSTNHTRTIVHCELNMNKGIFDIMAPKGKLA
jgi:hypothetical protein